MAIAGRRPRRERRIGRPTGGFGYNYVNPQVPSAQFGPTGTPILDNFNFGASQALDTRAGWNSVSPQPEFWGSMSTDAAPSSAVGQIAANAWGTNFLDFEVWLTMKIWPQVNDLRIYARWNQAGQFGYWLQCFNVNATNWEFHIKSRARDGSNTDFASHDVGAGGVTGVGLIAGDSIGFTGVGSTLKSWVHSSGTGYVWTVVDTANNSDWPGSGQIGMGSEDSITNLAVDTFGGGGTLDPSGPKSDISVVRRAWAGR